MPHVLEGRTALITGAAAGIGEAVADLFADSGAHVYLNDRDAEPLHAVCNEIRARGGSAFAFPGDVRRAADIAAAVDDALARFGRIDILINNAGIYPRRLFLDMTEAEWDDVVDINLKGVFHCTKLVLPHMVARRYGKIVNISSVNFFKGGAQLSHYTAAKAGVVGLTRSLSREVGPHNVYVNCITPGAVEVAAEKVFADPNEIAGLVAQQSIARRIQPHDIARVCLFLSCEWSDGLTGQTINVDGGRILH